MTAVLCRHFGLKHIEIAEDIASDTFLKASEWWALHGVPDNPAAWLYTVAKNKTRDYLKRLAIFENQVGPGAGTEDMQETEDFDFTWQAIADSQLAMIFAVCNPANSIESQICLALQILCGFSVEEIAGAFLSKPETIKKRLFRARATLREDNFQIGNLQKEAIRERLDAVLRTIYLLFNEGYSSRSNDLLIRKDLCSEAIRLALVLTENQLTNTTDANALMALMCFQSSRFDARSSETGEAILFEDQDKELWNKELIGKGNYYLVNACKGDQISKYHLEAGIAYWHTSPAGVEKWAQVLNLYNQLIIIEYSSVTALNRAFVFARVYGNAAGIRETEKLKLSENPYYHSLLGYLYAGIDKAKTIAHYEQSIALTKSLAECKTLTRELEKLKLN